MLDLHESTGAVSVALHQDNWGFFDGCAAFGKYTRQSLHTEIEYRLQLSVATDAALLDFAKQHLKVS
jgi:hypothetical protein